MMRSNNNGTTMTLPIHTGNINSMNKSNEPSEQFSNALSRGLDVVGLKKTKAGSNQKEIGYVMRQNTLLRVFLCAVLFALVSSITIILNYYELGIVKRGYLNSELKHHIIERADHDEFIRASLMLQKALKDDIREMDEMEEFRAFFHKAMGSHVDNIEDIMKRHQISEDTQSQVKEINQKVFKSLSETLTRMIKRFALHSKVAKERLRSVSDDIIRAIEEDERIDSRFKMILKKYGRDPEEDNYNVEDSYDDTDNYLEEKESVKEKNDGEQHQQTRKDIIETNEMEIKTKLKHMYDQLIAFEFPRVSEEILSKWTEILSKAEEELEDETKDVDLDNILNQFNKASLPTIPGYEANIHGPVHDYIRTMIEYAKLIKHKDELIAMFDKWQENKKSSPYALMGNLEKFAEKNGIYILFDWFRDGASE